MAHEKQAVQALDKRFREVCADLNLDKLSADEALQTFQRIGINYTLEVSFLLHLASLWDAALFCFLLLLAPFSLLVVLEQAPGQASAIHLVVN